MIEQTIPPPGRQRDALIAERVFGWHVEWYDGIPAIPTPGHPAGDHDEVWPYSTDDEKALLNEVEYLRAELDDLKAQLAKTRQRARKNARRAREARAKFAEGERLTMHYVKQLHKAEAEREAAHAARQRAETREYDALHELDNMTARAERLQQQYADARAQLQVLTKAAEYALSHPPEKGLANLRKVVDALFAATPDATQGERG